MQELSGRVAVVTGAASGIGWGLAERFAAEGMRVVLADIERPALDAAVARLAERGHEVLGVPTDVTDPAAVEALAAKTIERFGGVHVLCNNAGVAAEGDWGSLAGGRPLPVWELDLKDWQWTFSVNLWGVLHGIRAFVPLMLARGEEGHIVNTASVLGFFGGADLVAYGTTKFAVVRVSEALHMQLRERGAALRVSVLCPGGVATNSADAQRNRPPALRSARAAGVAEPLRRQRVEATRRSMAERGMPPSEVAQHVVDAIQAERFYIFTHPDSDEAIRARTERVLARRDPAPPGSLGATANGSEQELPRLGNGGRRRSEG